MTCDVLVVGSLHLDAVVNAPRLPQLDETLMGTAVAYRFGGKGGNQAVAAARMGAATCMSGRVGNDEFAKLLLRELDDAGVDRKGIQQGPGATGMSVAIMDDDGNYGAVVVSGVNRDIDATSIAVPTDVRVVCLQNEIPETINLAVARAAKAVGAIVILNAAPARNVSHDLFSDVDILAVNRVEAAVFSKADDPKEMARELQGLGPDIAIVTLGKDGLVWCKKGEPPNSEPAYSVPQVSTHGAGDMFIGALAARLADDAPLAGALRFAQAAAALHVSLQIENRRAITNERVDSFLEAQSSSR